jgi:chromosome partitioning protein
LNSGFFSSFAGFQRESFARTATGVRMGAIIAVANQKGGVGKTTTAVNLAAALAMAQRKTLLVDMDAQANATSGLGVDPGQLERHTYHVLVEGASIASVAAPTEIKNLHLAPAGRDLSGAEIELGNRAEWEYALADQLRPAAAEYDFVLIDCPPSLSRITVNALVAADNVLVPLQCEYYAMEGLSKLVETVAAVGEGLNPKLALAGIVLTMFDARTNLSRQVAEEVRGHFGDLVFETVVPRSVRLAEAPSFGVPVFLHDIRSTGSAAYLELSRELLRRFDNAAAPPAGEQGESAHG